VLEFIRKLDVFGINIKMTYAGEETFKTLFGAFFSIFVGMIILSYFTYKAIIMFNLLDAKTSK